MTSEIKLSRQILFKYWYISNLDSSYISVTFLDSFFKGLCNCMLNVKEWLLKTKVKIPLVHYQLNLVFQTKNISNFLSYLLTKLQEMSKDRSSHPVQLIGCIVIRSHNEWFKNNLLTKSLNSFDFYCFCFAFYWSGSDLVSCTPNNITGTNFSVAASAHRGLSVLVQ